MENNIQKKPGLFARLFGKGWEEAVQELESRNTKLDQREAALIKRENELSKKESEFEKRKSELQRREAKVREQEKKLKRKEKARERMTAREVEELEIQTKPQVEVYTGPKAEELINKEEIKVEEKLEIAEETKTESIEIGSEHIEEVEPIVEKEPETEIKEQMVEDLEKVEESKEEDVKVESEPEIEVEPEVKIEESKAEEKLEIVEEPKVEEIKNESETKMEAQVKEQKAKKQKAKSKKSEVKKVNEKNQPQKKPEYSEELNEKRNGAILKAIQELNAKMEEQLKLDDIQAATATTRSPESEKMIQKRRTANVATIRGYLFGLIAAYLDTLPEGDLKYIEIEGLTSTEFLRFLASDYEFEFKRDEKNAKSSADAKDGNFAGKRFIYGCMNGYGKIIKDVIENEKYATEIIGLANTELIGSYLDETLDKITPNKRKGIRINNQKLVKRDERLEKEFGEAGQVL